MMYRRFAVLLVTLVAGCSGASDGGAAHSSLSSGAATADSIAESSAGPGSIDRAYDVGGHRLQLTCQGTAAAGVPTIVYLHGLGGAGGDGAVLQPFIDRTRVCSYDRLNVGRSDTSPDRHTGADSVRDLHALLDAADLQGPYLLVGFSFGGLLATMYAGSHPDRVMGLISIDGSLASDSEVDQLIPAAERAAVVDEQQANGELVDFYATLEEAKALLDTVPNVPITYLAARPVDLPPSWPVQHMRAVIAAHQEEFAAAYPQGRLVEVQSSHDIDLDHPEIVIREVERILQTA